MSNYSRLSSALKRGLDVAVSATGLLLLSPLFAAVIVAVRLNSKGPVIFRQVRVGRDFRRFEILKFRTMYLHAAETGPLVTAAADVRITGLGRLLRRTKLDELPQLWNVLRGEMSLVGPRPEVPHYVELFREDYAEVLRARPGVTDLASLAFRDEEQILAAAVDPEQHYRDHVLPAKIALNKDYVRRASLAFDLEIIAKTLVEATGARILPLPRWMFRHRSSIVVALHLLMIVAANYLSFWLRFDGRIPGPEQAIWLRTILVLLLIRVPALAVFRLFEGLWRYTSVHDLRNILAAVIGSEAVFYVVVRIGMGEVAYPRSVFLIDAMLLVFLMGGVRLAKRYYEESGHLRASHRVLVVGDWDRADFVIRAMKSHVLGNYRPVGIVSTSPGALGRRIHGVPVLGSVRNLEALVRASIADEVVLAYDRGLAELDAQVIEALSPLGHPVRDAFQLMVTVVDRQIPRIAHSADETLAQPARAARPSRIAHS